MKKRFLLYATLVAGMFTSCSEGALVEVKSSNDSTSIITTIEATIVDTDAETTKTVRKSDGKIYWNPGDEINVFFGTDKGKFTSSNTEDAAKASFNGSITISSVIGMNEGEDDDNCVWGLYPYNENATFDGTYVHTSLPNVQTGKAGSFADDLYITLAKSNSFKLSFYNTLAGIKFSVQKEGIRKIEFSGNNGEILTGDMKLKYGDDERPVVSEITNGKTSITLTPDGMTFSVGEYYYIVFTPVTFSKGFTLSFTTATEKGDYTYNKSISFPRNMFGTLTSADKDVTFTALYSQYEYVDLGLPSGLLWATCNVGASSPEDSGGYYAWGETEEKSYYDWSTYKYSEGSVEKITKYCTDSSYSSYGFTDEQTILDASDDVAHVKWGGTWRMPTSGEWIELKENCSWRWTTLNGTKGYMVTGKKTGYTDKYIFLPAVGCRFLNRLDNFSIYGPIGYYWSSSRDYDEKNLTRYVSFTSNDYCCSVGSRFSGFSVRPVCQSSTYVPVTGIELNETAISLYVGDNFALSAMVIPSNATNTSVVDWASTNKSVATVDSNGNVKAGKDGTAIIMVASADGGYIAKCSVTVCSNTNYEYVDLGLSVKWATRNVGANKPEDYGDYYAWGETTEAKYFYEWRTYKYCEWGGDEDPDKLTKYCNDSRYGYNDFTDNKTVLDLSDDVAHVKWGGNWRIPTAAEWNELLDRNNCTWTKVTKNSVVGFLVTSKKVGYTSNSIFLPCAGWKYDDPPYNRNGSGYYWSSSLFESYPFNAWYTLLLGDSMGGYSRDIGMSVRPVCPKHFLSN